MRILSRARRVGAVAVAVAVAVVAGASSAAAATKLYRFALGIGTNPARYVLPLSATKPTGPYFRVTTDAAGRIASVESLRSGTVLSRIDYAYEAGAAHPSKAATFIKGEAAGSRLLSYYPDGKLKRLETYTVLGKLTGYETCEPIAGGARDCLDHNPEGKPIEHYQSTFGADGVLVQQKHWREGDKQFYLVKLDPTNGLEIESRLIRFDNGAVLNIARRTYDANGDQVRADAFTADGTSPFASMEFADDLMQKKSYRYTDGQTYVVQAHYGANRWRTGADILVNGKLAFRFAYVWQSDGTILKSQALGLDGELWAEYPDLFLDEVTRQGAVRLGNPNAGAVYHKQPWW